MYVPDDELNQLQVFQALHYKFVDKCLHIRHIHDFFSKHVDSKSQKSLHFSTLQSLDVFFKNYEISLVKKGVVWMWYPDENSFWKQGNQ